MSSSDSSLSHKVIRNTIVGACARLWNIAVALALTPYIVRRLGNEGYGVWALTFALTGYAGLLDFGIGSSFVKFIAEFQAKDDRDDINRVINTGLCFYCVLAVLVCALSLFFMRDIVSFFKLSPVLQKEAVLVFCISVVTFGISGVFSIFESVPGGLQRMDVTSRVGIAFSIPMVAGTVFCLEKGYGLTGLVINNALMTLGTGLTNIIFAYRLFPGLRLSARHVDGAMLKRLFRFGGQLQVVRIATAIHFHADKFILAHFLDIASVTFYSLASSLATRARELPQMVLAAVMPASSELSVRTDPAALDALYHRSMKYLLLLAVPVWALLVLLARPFIHTWLGAGYERTILALRVFATTYFLNLLTGPGFFILNGMGKPHVGMRTALLGICTNIPISVWAAAHYGYYGLVIGSGLALCIPTAYFLCVQHGEMRIPPRRTLDILSRRFAAVNGTLLLAGIVALRRWPELGWIGLTLFSALYIAFYIGAVLKIHHIDDFDRQVLRKAWFWLSGTPGCAA